jgi:hypothetical protein
MFTEDAMWRHPVPAATVDDRLWADLRHLYRRIGAMLDHLDALPQAMPHGDASPQNLLVPAAAPDSLVAIDAAITTPHAVGFDLGQLLVGLVHAGQLPAAALPEVHEVLVPSYVDGCRAAGAEVDTHSGQRGYVLTLMVRSVFTSVPFDTLDDADAHAKTHQRAALTRYIVDLTIPIINR